MISNEVKMNKDMGVDGCRTDAERVFGHSGFASISDLATKRWRDTFQALEREQETFLRKCQPLFSKEYIWPRDPLHTWSRVWEYPFVYYHIQNAVSGLNAAQPSVVDLGSGATFFPFAVAHLGCKVVCIDTDPSGETTMKGAIGSVSSEPGKVEFRLSDGVNLPASDGEVDILYCISVLEHVAEFERTIGEVARVLRPNGLFLLTFDVDLQGNSQIGVPEYRRLRECLDMQFEFVHPDMTVHPRDVLHSRTGPYPLMLPRRISMLKAIGFGWLAEMLFGKLVYGGAQGVHMTVQGMALSKRSRSSLSRA